MQGNETPGNLDCHTSAHGASCECVYNAQFDRRRAVRERDEAIAERDAALRQVHEMSIELMAAASRVTHHSAVELRDVLESRAHENERLRLECLRELAICQREVVSDDTSPTRIALGVLSHVLHNAGIEWPRRPL